MNRRELFRAGAMAGLAGASGILSFPGRSLAGLQAPAPATRPPARQPMAPLQLNWNENPLGLAAAARQAALDALATGHRYPDAAREEFTATLAAHLGLEPRHLVLGNGSTEILQMIVQTASAAVSAPNPALVLASPTFQAVSRYQRPHAYTTERVPLDGRMAHDLGRMRERTRALDRAAVVYVCNPNNPTATVTPSAELDAWIAEAPESVLFAVDEAYFEYVGETSYRSALHWVRKRPNVVVTRTFSKIYGMAGMRLGYAAAHPETAARLREFMALDNANGPALAAARASLADPDLVSRRRAVNAKARKIATDCLDELGLEHLPSHTSFLMHRIRGDLETYIRRMREHGVRVGRPFPPMLTYNRLSIGLPEEMERFTELLREFRKKGWV